MQSSGFIIFSRRTLCCGLASKSVGKHTVQRTAGEVPRYTERKLIRKAGGKFMATFEELKTRYQSVLQVIQTKQVHLANMHLQDGKLYLKGTAPSQEAANAVWDEIKKINPKADDIAADFPIDTSLQRTYKVQPGDTLSKIS